tara:strand:- start:1705 stop:1920 length:216 start_codon:yes stop_codon:yes gene_type:complete
MDKLDELIIKFNNKKNTHPELSLLWINYLNIKKNKLLELEQQAQYTLECMNSVHDISLQTILFLLTIDVNI